MARVITLREFMDNPNVQTVSRSDTFGGMTVSWRWITKTAASDDVDGQPIYGIVDNGKVTYHRHDEVLAALDLAEEDKVLAFYLPGTEPPEPRHYGVWKIDPKHPEGGHWYTNEAYSESNAWKWAHHYEFYQVIQPRKERTGINFEARLLPEDEWR